ncbi:MAG TPA: hypothetical protein RMF84_04950 [Polyangiaceae bacterium LLY-WYZ-14_1]|nr:hypothetical protein [Polyangiaceae bacterium LLY-WYZ-14_1]
MAARIAVVLVSISVALVPACTTVGELSPGQDRVAAPAVCDEPDAPTPCGTACSADAQCALGLYCQDGRCAADCWAGRACAEEGASCSERGRCLGPDVDGGPLPDAGPRPDGGDDCAEVAVQLEATVPNVLFIVDRSGSMLEDFRDTDDDRWDVLFDGLFREPGEDGPGDEGGIIRRLDGIVPFGVSLYTYEDDLPASQCPVIREVGIQLGAAEELADLFRDEPPPEFGETPTGDSIAAIRAALPVDELEGPVVFVVATDGAPDRCENPDAHDADSRRESIDAVQAAHAAGIDTFMISLANVGQRHMQDMANAGVGLPVLDEGQRYPDDAELAPFYDPQDTGELADDLTEIVTGAVSCELEVDGELIVDRACEGTLEVDGEAVPCDQPGGGWRAVDDGTLELLGSLCDDFRAGRIASVRGVFPCDTVILR